MMLISSWASVELLVFVFHCVKYRKRRLVWSSFSWFMTAWNCSMSETSAKENKTLAENLYKIKDAMTMTILNQMIYQDLE